MIVREAKQFTLIILKLKDNLFICIIVLKSNYYWLKLSQQKVGKLKASEHVKCQNIN